MTPEIIQAVGQYIVIPVGAFFALIAFIYMVFKDL